MLRPEIIKILLVVVLCATINYTESQTNYCRPRLCGGKRHIACNNSGNFKAACARNARVITMTANLRQAIVNRHNAYRNMVARGSLKRFRPAVRMAPMRWNRELARLAALNVKQCVMRHDKCRNTRKFHFAGQNLANTMWSGSNRQVKGLALEQIRNWFREHTKTTRRQIQKFPTSNLKAIGHFTAMMQEKNTHVGCAILRQTKNGRTEQLMACNYAYTNISGKPVYRSGRVGSKCRTGRHRRWKGLCSARERYNVNKAGY